MRRVIKRVARKIGYYKGKTMLLIIFFTALFFMFLGTLIAYEAVNQEMKSTEQSIGKSLCIYKKWKAPENELEETYESIPNEESQKIVQSEYVSDYNFLLNGEKTFEDKEYPMMGIRDFEKSPFFSALGFYLVEGKKIEPSNENENIIMISKTFAEEHQLKVGDLMTVSSSASDLMACGERTLEVSVCGIYASGKAEQETESEILFLPYKALEKSYFAIGGPFVIQLYFESMDDIKSYVSDFESRFPVDSEAEHYYQYYWNQDGYQQIIQPLKELIRICRVLLFIIGLGIVVIVWNLGTMMFRANKREYAILLSTGETMKDIIFQNILEQIFPVVCAVVIAFGVMWAVSGNLTNWLTETYTENQEELSTMLEHKNQRELMGNTDAIRILYQPNTTDIQLKRIERPSLPREWIFSVLLVFIIGIPMELSVQMWLTMRKKSVRSIMQEE